MAIANGNTAFSATAGLSITTPPLGTVVHLRVPPYETGYSAARQGAASASYGAGSFRAVVPSDTLPLDPGCRGLYVAGAGTLAVKGVFDGTSVSLGTLAVGVTIPGRFGFVMSTGTSATIVALYS